MTDAADHSRQLTIRALVLGMFLGGFMSLSNLYVALKTGWSLGVSITAGILAFAIFSSLFQLRAIRTPFGILENNAMQSVASAAGYMTGGGTVAAIPALMMITGHSMPWWQMFPWISVIAMLGVVMAIPMKQQMIDIEQLRFPTGIAAAETLQALHGGTEDSNAKAKRLGIAGLFGAGLALWRDGILRLPNPYRRVDLVPWHLPAKLEIPWVKLIGKPLVDYTLAFEVSVIMLGAGAIMGFRAAWSMLLGALINYGVLAPILFSNGILPKLGYKTIVGWSVWFGSAMILTSGLLSFAFQYQTIWRAISSVGAAFRGKAVDDRQVPMSWFLIGVAVFSPMVVFLQWLFFGIAPWMGVLSVFLSFFIAIVACRVTGETDTTPTGALGKITQITYGVLDPGNTTTNLMTAQVTGGVALHSADLLTDLKSGYLLGADPRQQFWAQFFGVVAGSMFVVPAFHLLIPDASLLGTDQWPAPGGQTWMNVAKMLAEGVDSIHWSARLALLAGAELGVLLVLFERWFPKVKPYIPSPAGLGLAFTTPGYNTISMFLGATVALLIERRNKKQADDLIVPVSSGWIAGESLMGVAIAAAVMAGILSQN